jgi:transcriptional regulator with XRE-family HTH domain
MAGGGEVRSLGDRLKAKREERGLSLSQAARELDVARTAYRLWELEAARPAPDRWRLVARWLGVSMTTLLVAEGLIEAEQTVDSEWAAMGYEAPASEPAPAAADPRDDEFFDQAQSLLDRSLEAGVITAAEAGRLRSMFQRIRKGLAPPDEAS